MPGGLFKLPRKKRPLQQSNSQSFEEDESEEEFKRKKMLWLDGMLQLNEQQRYINQLKIQKLERDLAQNVKPDGDGKENLTYDEYSHYTLTTLT